MSPKNIAIGLIGAGYMGEKHLRHLTSLPDVDVVGVFDPIQAKAHTLAAKYKVPQAPQLRKMLEEAAAVVICVPTTAHYEVAAEAIRQNCHVFVEKPFTHTVSEATALCRLADLHGVHVQVGHVERFNPVVRTLLRSVQYERLVMGEFYRYAPLRKNIDADVLLTLMVHDLDLLLHIANRIKVSPRKIQASGQVIYPKEMNRELIDNAMVHIPFDGPFQAAIHAVRTGGLHRREIILTETDQTWVADLLHQRLDRFTRSGRYTHHVDTQRIEVPNISPLSEEIKEFVTVVKTGRPPEVSQHDGLRVMKWVDRIRSQMVKRSDNK
ncbi:MAG: Gfo/Idh/MocA family oxidoreductase [Firmicutes bacterium]|uniref:Oxidoreductase family, NAD-binding Rossmann fold n=1 Tax=Melghirimyces thermohalophilus TaxID=1236220 RepID=A0A1G6KV22_9BACL|nr:Gfo/Idh/MocA family oxidoreductase [Melghirimyces thermohalophilus]MDA8353229.1 Gfo/Idh/MocA family oxidoreductase [Bacillota bacterium]SDC34226.1 Oxidoreductase family, NAD-binding Rossmann fold [Melghirimyces thermohalophilus]